MVLPATTEPSFAMTLTAVHALPINGVKAKVVATNVAINFLIICFFIENP
jgi:hypothetical protein